MTNIRSRAWRWVWRALKGVLVIGVVAGVVYWLKFSPVPVAQHQVERGDIVAEVMGTGTLEAHFKSTDQSQDCGPLAGGSRGPGRRGEGGQAVGQARRCGYEAAGGNRTGVGCRRAGRARPLAGGSRPGPAVLEQTTAITNERWNCCRRTRSAIGGGQDHRRLEGRPGRGRTRRSGARRRRASN